MELGRLFPKRPIKDDQDPFREDLTGVQVEPREKTFVVNPEDIKSGSSAGREDLELFTGDVATGHIAHLPDSDSK